MKDQSLIDNVIAAAREWVVDRSPSDEAEKVLFRAVFMAFPEDMQTRETCTACDAEQRANCEECLSQSNADYLLRRLPSLAMGG